MKRSLKRRQNHQKTILTSAIAFLIPFVVSIIILALKGIYPGSERTILASDGFHQYVIFHTGLKNALQENGSLFYTFTSGLGLNFYALMSYYLGSFLSPLGYFFTLETMPDAIYLMTILKFGLIGLSTNLSLQNIYRKLDKTYTILLSTSFALMSFSSSQLEITMWLDVFIIVPLIMWGLDRLLKEEGRLLYYLSLTTLFIQNYYFGFMMAVFLTLWYLVQLTWDFKSRRKTFTDFTVVSLLAGLTSLVMILPAIFDLKTHGETLSTFTQFTTEGSWWLDIFAKNIIGSYDTTKFGSIPTLYAGLIPLLLALTFFLIRSIKWPVKLSYLILIGFLIASFYLEPLDLFWQGMHAPNMFLHRYSWVWSLLIIWMAAETLLRLQQLTTFTALIPYILFSSGFILTYLYREKYDFLEPIHFLLTLEFLIVYLFLVLFRKNIAQKQLVLSLLFFSLFEISLNAYYQVSGLEEEWHFPSRENYSQNMTDIVNLVDSIKERHTDFFRTERWLPQTGNDSMKYDYNGISQFSSIRNRSSSQLLDQLGFKSSGTNLNLRYQNNTLLMDLLFGITYNIAEDMPSKYGFYPLETTNSVKLYESENSASLAILSSAPYQDIPLTHSHLDNQTKLVNALIGQDLTYFYELETVNQSNHSSDNILEKDPSYPQSNDASAYFEVLTDRDSQLYLNLEGLSLTNDDYDTVDIIVNGRRFEYTVDNAYPLFNLGFFTANQRLQIRIVFPNQDTVNYDHLRIIALSIDAFQKASDAINQLSTETQISKNVVETSYNATNMTSLLYTIPFDDGWTASVNGQKTAVEPFQEGLIKVDVPEGQGKVVLTFVPKGLKEGIIACVIGVLGFSLYEFKTKRPKTSRE
ncbi:YfhO family protein [Streptococcus moroccensis]|uniref:Membrane protein YfhO n=1 Tax=Streptococcus moroccensis TaxID=1451356 RepID=A0ABT9YRD1_9STRE|nr:YfhO family protein [Streptococcus moroccensis]MDQ0222550.1 putative membrane protein YfhO [Streptococcus moroccensis]